MTDSTALARVPERVLVVTAHPDDVDFSSSGTIATWVAAGSAVTYCIVTDGTAGGFDRTIERSAMAEIRRAEQRAAAAVVGVGEVRFLGGTDGEVVADLALRRAISRQIRELRPELVVTSSPERNYARMPASHPDHRAVGEATLCAVYPDARNPFAFPELLDEGFEPHVVHEVWLAGYPAPDHAVDITEVLDKKLAAIGAHASQLPDREQTERFVREWTAAEAERAGLGPGRHAEAFKIVRIG